MKELSRKFERFCMKRRDKGIRNLMLYIAVGNAAVYLLSLLKVQIAGWNIVDLLFFDRMCILQGQVWRLLTFLIAPSYGTGIFASLLLFLLLFFYYRIGLLLEQTLGVFKFNLFYFTGVLLMDAAGMLFDVAFGSTALNLSLLLAFATLYPENRVLLFFVIPLKIKYLAWFYLAWTVVDIVMYKTFMPLVPLLNWVLFFWREIPGLLPALRRSGAQPKQKPSKDWAKDYRSRSGEKPYRHKCTVCGRTDAQYPDLEFRYCSKCNGYYCYCMDHINNHVHIQ
ncbi:MAG: hypothetical protein IJT18_04805 [Oscillospiraceae bacterium]|nr:hypothetical protein [Oscillospiraceae bacterium]